jgi:hypothetical protein
MTLTDVLAPLPSRPLPVERNVLLSSLPNVSELRGLGNNTETFCVLVPSILASA